MLCLSGFELYSRWVPLTEKPFLCKMRKITFLYHPNNLSLLFFFICFYFFEKRL